MEVAEGYGEDRQEACARAQPIHSASQHSHQEDAQDWTIKRRTHFVDSFNNGRRNRPAKQRHNEDRNSPKNRHAARQQDR